MLSNNKIIIDKINKLRSHGIERNKKNLIIKKNFSNWYYEAQDLSFNFRISDINCALGISQLKKLNSFVKYRKNVAKIYDKELSDLKGVFTPKIIHNNSHAYHLYPVRIDFKKLNLDKKKLFNYFLKKIINYKYIIYQYTCTHIIKKNIIINLKIFQYQINFTNKLCQYQIFLDFQNQNNMSL